MPTRRRPNTGPARSTGDATGSGELGPCDLTEVAMTFLIVKYAVTALVIVVVSEVAKRSDRVGALIASLPLVTVMVMIWLHLEKQPEAKIANHAYYTFWYVLPTMPMFLLMPWMIRKGLGFWPALGAGCVLTFLCFALAALLLKRIGVDLMP